MRNILLMCIVVCLAATGFADVPHLVSYQGRLTEDGTGEPVPDGTYNITFRLFNVASGGSAIWSENYPAVDVSGGTYCVMLGSNTPFPTTVDFANPYWLEVQVGATTLSPRYQLGASPYALNIADTIRKTASQVFEGATSDGIQILSPGFAGIYIDEPFYNGIDVYNAGNRAFYAYEPESDGFYADTPGGVGFRVLESASHGFFAIHPDSAGMIIRYPGTNGIEIDGSAISGAGILIQDPIGVGDPDTGIVIRDVGTKGISIHSPGEEGIRIVNPGAYGISIYNSESFGIVIESSGSNGIDIYEPTYNGINISCDEDVGRGIHIYDNSSTGDPDTGIVIANAGHYGIYIRNPMGRGLEIDNSGNLGILVSNSNHHAIGVEEPDGMGIYVYRSGEEGLDIFEPGSHGVDVTGPFGDCYVCDGSPYRLFRVSNKGDVYGHGFYSYIVDEQGRGVKAPLMKSTGDWIEHIGSGSISGGTARIELPPEFIEATDGSIKVFISPTSPLGDYWIEKSAGWFTVHRDLTNTSAATFDYRVIAGVKGSESNGIEKIKLNENYVNKEWE